MRIIRVVSCLLLICQVSGVERPAHAAGDRTDTLLKLLRSRPRGMSIDTWREQRREAARELGKQKDRRAVPVLLRIIKKERFDVILEIAIDALGNIGDKRAADPLKGLLDDPSLDAYVRDAAASALKKLGAPAEKAPPRLPTRPRQPTRPTDPGKPAKPPEQQHGFGKLPKLTLDKIDPTLIARSSRMELIVGAGHLDWNTSYDRANAAFGLRSRYRRQQESKGYGYTFDLAADFDFGLASPPDPQESSWNLGHQLQLNPEIRFYPFSRDVPKLFGQFVGGFGYGLNVAKVPVAPDKRFSFAGTVAAGGGPGFGRVYDIGPGLRLKRVLRVLRKAGFIEKDKTIDPIVRNQILQAWYQLRNKLGSFERLGYTLRLLRQASLLQQTKGSIDPATTYRLVRILDDPQLEDRRSGMMFRAGYGYSRSLLKDADDITMAYVYGSAEYHLQRGTTRSFSAELRAFYNMWGEPDTFNVRLTANYGWYLYNRAFDPLGAIHLDAIVGVDKQHGSEFEGGGSAYTLLGGATYTRYFSRGSSVATSLRGGMQYGGATILLSLEGSYGIASGSFATAD